MYLRKRRGRWLGLVLAIALVIPMASTPIEPIAQEAREVAPIATYASYITYGGKETNIPVKTIGGRAYAPMHAFVAAFTKAEYHFDRASGYATLTASGLVISAGLGGTFITANDRPLYGVGANRMIDGTLWVPVSVLAKACGLTASTRDGRVTLSGSYKALTHAKDFYREDEVYWLSRIISAESKGESLRGQIAVGNVVLNRVRDPRFPNTIYGVIFEKWQFTPAMNGTIYESPSWLSTIAAKMALEGYAISNEILFFCNPKMSDSHWVEQNRPYAFTIGRHAFYY